MASFADLPSKQSLRSQAERIWKARSARDCSTITEFLDPMEYDGSTPEQRRSVCEQDPFRYDKFRIENVEVEGRYGWVTVTYVAVLAKYENQPAQETQYIEKWRLVRDQWYPVATRILETCPERPTERDLADEESLRKRFDQTWPLRLSKNWKALYEFTDPNDRIRVAESQFVESEALLEYYAHEVDWVQAKSGAGEVRVTYENKLMDPNMTKLPRKKVNLSEHWVKRNGEWYRDLVRGH